MAAPRSPQSPRPRAPVLSRPRAPAPARTASPVQGATSSSGTAKSSTVVTAAAVARKRREHATLRERILMSSLISGGVVLAVLGAVSIAQGMRESRAQAAMIGTFVLVTEQQDEFRRNNLRFANLTELSARGFRVPDQQVVRRLTADESHWFLSLRDRETGLICDRNGLMPLAPSPVREPACR